MQDIPAARTLVLDREITYGWCSIRGLCAARRDTPGLTIVARSPRAACGTGGHGGEGQAQVGGDQICFAGSL